MYLSSLIDAGKSSSAIMRAFDGIKWFHGINGMVDPT